MTELTREEALKQQRDRLRERGAWNFFPSTGRCYSCGADLIEHYGAERVAAGIEITGCPVCHRSYCD